MPASKAQRAVTADRRTKAIALRLAGRSYQSIADELGYHNQGAAWNDINRALEANLAEQHRNADLLREEELLRLDEIWFGTWEVFKRRHVTVSQGKLIFHDGEPLLDDDPVLRAVDRLLKIQERRARYLGLDAPQRHEVTLDELDRQIRELAAELGEATPDETPGAPPPTPDQG